MYTNISNTIARIFLFVLNIFLTRPIILSFFLGSIPFSFKYIQGFFNRKRLYTVACPTVQYSLYTTAIVGLGMP